MSLGGILLSFRVHGGKANKIISNGIPVKSDHQPSVHLLSSTPMVHVCSLKHREFSKSMERLEELREFIECLFYLEHKQKRKF